MSDYYKLLPCPFCGGKATVMLEQDSSSNKAYCCFCLDCDAETYGDTDDEAVQKWNSRVNSHIKIQYHNEELTVQELCNRLEKVENEKKMAINDLRVCSIENFMECQYCLCKTARSFCWDCTDGPNWKYRGEREN